MTVSAMTSLATALSGPLVEIIDNLFTSEEERAAAKLKLLSLEMQPYLAQLDVNREEAKSTRLFVAGWRPFIGWTCGSVFAWNYIVAPLLYWIFLLMGIPVPPIPTLGLAEITPVLMGLLGLGGMRTYEKLNGVEGNR